MSTVRPDESILTDRLDLRPVAVEDADELAAIFADSRLYVFTGGDPSTLEALRSTFARLADARTASDTAQLNWVVRRRGDDPERSGCCRPSSPMAAMRPRSRG